MRKRPGGTGLFPLEVFIKEIRHGERKSTDYLFSSLVGPSD